MKNRVYSASQVTEGAGVQIFRAIGTSALPSLDPFLMLDFFSSANPDDYLAGFPDHPHRGFITITYMLDGRMRHKDSMGNEGLLLPGAVQWMKAASGVIHSEMPEQENGLMRGFQLWLNLPAVQKMTDPEYRDIDAASIPCIEFAGGSLKLIAGSFESQRGPVTDPFTDLYYADLRLQPGAQFKHPIGSGRSAIAFVFEGSAVINEAELEQGQIQILPGSVLRVRAGQQGVSLLLCAAQPLAEPVAHHGPFVMNEVSEIRRAIDDFRNGTLVRKRAEKH